MAEEPLSERVTAAPGADDHKLRLELARLQLERSKLALDIRLRRRELRLHAAKTFRDAVANPLVLAIVGGSITLLTSIVTNYLTASANREADDRRAQQVRDAEGRALQSELIKTFLKTQDSKTARDNLTFLIESGLIPDHEARIKEYLASNTKAAPKIADSPAASVTYPECPKLDPGRAADDQGATGTAVAVSLHLGTNRLNPAAYGGWDGQIIGAVPDANAMHKLATGLGFRAHLFVDAQARADCLVASLATLAATLRSGDSLMITLSGHGAQMPDGSGNEPDKKIETWMLFDKQLSATELFDAFARFRPGVTLLVVQDTSHPAAFRVPPRGKDLAANLVVLAGAQENQVAMDGAKNGAFTTALLEAWNDGRFNGTYQDLVAAIRRKMPASQEPQLYTRGPDAGLAQRSAFRWSNPASGTDTATRR
jgi:hypothetical protein